MPVKRTKLKNWRKRVGVEPTIRPAKGRIAGFEGRESHRTLFASGTKYRVLAGGFQRLARTAEILRWASSMSFELVQIS
jgi:hypothetical protein